MTLSSLGCCLPLFALALCGKLQGKGVGPRRKLGRHLWSEMKDSYVSLLHTTRNDSRGSDRITKDWWRCFGFQGFWQETGPSVLPSPPSGSPKSPNTGIQQFSSVHSLSHVQLFATPWTAARQASLSITNSRSLLKLVGDAIPPSHPLSSPSPPAFNLS